MSVSEVLGARIKKVRKEKGFTQDEMASKIGCARMSYVHYENAKRTPDIDFLVRASNVIGCSTDFLLGKAECSTPDNEEIHRQLGISERTINALKILNEYAIRLPPNKLILDTINILLSTFKGKKILNLLSDYLYGDFSAGYVSPKDSTTQKNGFTHIYFKTRPGNPGRIEKFPSEMMRELILMKLLETLHDIYISGGEANAQQESE